MNCDSISKPSKSAEWKGIIIYISLYIALSAFPISRIRSLWVIIPLYTTVLVLCVLAMKNTAIVAKILLSISGIGAVGLVAIYGHFLLPRQSMITLGTATVKTNPMPKLLLITSGFLALLTFAQYLSKAIRAIK